DGSRDVTAIFLADMVRDCPPISGRSNVTAVDGETGDHFAKRVLQAIEREIAGVTALFRNSVESSRKDMQLTGHRCAQDQFFALVRDVGEIGFRAGQSPVQLVKSRLALRIDEEAVEHG